MTKAKIETFDAAGIDVKLHPSETEEPFISIECYSVRVRSRQQALALADALVRGAEEVWPLRPGETDSWPYLDKADGG